MIIRYIGPLTVVLLLAFGLPCDVLASAPQPVKYVDLSRYLGRWYQVAHIPNMFQKQCYKDTQAEYSYLDSGLIQVRNTCRKKDGTVSSVVGVARVDNPGQNSKLSVSFFEVFGYRPVWGDYWILGLGNDYEYSVVGDRSKKYAWILARTPTLPKSTLEKAIQILKDNGFDTASLQIGSSAN